ncbi:hypothetical protein ACFW04_014075 [Cataglyphis niger]
MRNKIKEVIIGGCTSKTVRRKREWDSECKEEKNIVRKELRRFKEKGGDGNLYREAKGKYKKLIERKKKEERERWERELREIRTERQVWEMVNRERRRRWKVNKDITMKERVRRGCPMSPHLFNLVTADMEKVMSRCEWGGVDLEEKRIYTLAYADDVVLIAEEEDEMRSIIERLERYLEKKGLELNVGKSKILSGNLGLERKRKKLERLQERYLRWILGLEWEMPGYMVREELQREKLKRTAGRRAWGFEKRLEWDCGEMLGGIEGEM